MPGSHQSSLLNRSQSVSEWVSEWVSDKHSQWSDSGPIKIPHNNYKEIYTETKEVTDNDGTIVTCTYNLPFDAATAKVHRCPPSSWCMLIKGFFVADSIFVVDFFMKMLLKKIQDIFFILIAGPIVCHVWSGGEVLWAVIQTPPEKRLSKKSPSRWSLNSI